MKEEYVSYSQAVALKECGFDWECGRYYDPYGDLWNLDKPMGQSQSNTYSLAPTLALAQKWMREVKDMDIFVIPHCQNAYEVAAKRLGKVAHDTIFVFDLWDSKRPYPTYEAALSAGLDAALELMKRK